MSNTIENLKQALVEMRKERAVLAKGIAQVEATLASMGSPKLAGKTGARRGRPPGAKNKPKAASEAKASAKKKRAKPRWSDAQKRAAAERMRAYWANKKVEG